MVEALLFEGDARRLVGAIFKKGRPLVVPPSSAAEIGAVLHSRRGMEGEVHEFDWEVGRQMLDSLDAAQDGELTMPQITVEYFPPTEQGDPEYFVLAPTKYEPGEICARAMVGINGGKSLITSILFTATPYLAPKPIDSGGVVQLSAFARRRALRTSAGTSGTPQRSA